MSPSGKTRSQSRSIDHRDRTSLSYLRRRSMHCTWWRFGDTRFRVRRMARLTAGRSGAT